MSNVVCCEPLRSLIDGGDAGPLRVWLRAHASTVLDQPYDDFQTPSPVSVSLPEKAAHLLSDTAFFRRTV